MFSAAQQSGNGEWPDLIAFVVNLLLALGLVVTMFRLPRRFDGRHAGEMGVRKALGMPAFDGPTPEQAPRLAGILLAVFLAIGLLLLFLPQLRKVDFPRNWLVLFLDVVFVAVWVVVIRTLRKLHAAGTVSRPALRLLMERSGLHLFFVFLPQVSVELPAPWAWALLLPFFAVLVALMITVKLSVLAASAGFALVFNGIFLLLGHSLREATNRFAPWTDVSWMILSLMTAGTILLLFLRTPQDAIPRGQVWPKRQRAPTVS